MVDWYYIFSILLLGVSPYSPDIYNVHNIISWNLGWSLTVCFHAPESMDRISWWSLQSYHPSN
jgi:hypothetical protein